MLHKITDFEAFAGMQNFFYPLDPGVPFCAAWMVPFLSRELDARRRKKRDMPRGTSYKSTQAGDLRSQRHVAPVQDIRCRLNAEVHIPSRKRTQLPMRHIPS